VASGLTGESTMTQTTKRRRDDEKAWRELSRRWRGSPFLDLNPLYSLPVGVIDILPRQLPGVWTEEELKFERDLAQTTGGGFFHHRPFPCPFLPPPPDARVDSLLEEARELLAEELNREGLHELQIQRHFQAEEERRDEAVLRSLAYTGWLVTNPEFLAERDQWREVWEQRVADAGGFPALRLSCLGERPAPVGLDEAELHVFYRRWGLHTFLTWDVPVPIGPQLHHVVHANVIPLGSAGLLLFLPWFLLRDKDLSLETLVPGLRAVRQPAHLKGWLSRESGDQQELGYDRLKNLLVLYWCGGLALGGRYVDRLEGNAGRLDQAFATYLGLGPDSIKKLRNWFSAAIGG
jgi:hypothetical protein